MSSDGDTRSDILRASDNADAAVRLSRLRYLMYSLLTVGVIIVVWFALRGAEHEGALDGIIVGYAFMTSLAAGFAFVFYLSIRRLIDMGWSPAWALLLLMALLPMWLLLAVWPPRRKRYRP
jgi:uncharacterized membrane protein YhaH (DUF805 family)